jgi:hypothetical protein
MMEKVSHSSYQIFPQNQLILEQFSGLVSFEKFIEMKKAQWADSKFSKYYSLMADFRDGHFDHSVDLGKLIADLVEANHDKFGPIKLVIIATNPNQIITPILFRDEIGNKVAISLKICSTPEAAITWCGITQNEDQILDALNNPNHGQVKLAHS